LARNNSKALSETHAEVAAKTSMIRALVIKASANAKQAENKTIRPSFRAYSYRTYATTVLNVDVRIAY